MAVRTALFLADDECPLICCGNREQKVISRRNILAAYGEVAVAGKSGGWAPANRPDAAIRDNSTENLAPIDPRTGISGLDVLAVREFASSRAVGTSILVLL